MQKGAATQKNKTNKTTQQTEAGVNSGTYMGLMTKETKQTRTMLGGGVGGGACGEGEGQRRTEEENRSVRMKMSGLVVMENRRN